MEEKYMKLQVEVISTEFIKPSNPTPLHHKSFKISFLDQISPPYHMPLLLFYTNSLGYVNKNALKKSLAETLSHFYPLAGRIVDGQHAVSCNDEGIPFVETKVNCQLSTFLNYPRKLSLLSEFFPSKYFQQFDCRPISEIVHLAFQINVFQCGGFALGCYMFHKLLDAVSLGNFLKYWSCITNEHYNGELIEPDFVAPVIAFPPNPNIEPLSTIGIENSMLLSLFPPVDDEIVNKSFRFSRGAIEELKSMANCEELPKPTRFEVVAGFIWEHAFAAACTAGNVVADNYNECTAAIPTWFSFTVNVRERTNPPLPKDSMGNLITTVSSRAEEKEVGFRNLVAKIHSTVSKVKPMIENLMPKIEKSEVSPVEWFADDGVMSGMSYIPGCYKLSSWCNLGFNEVDFGFGKPNWIIPIDGQIHPIQRNFIILTDYSDSCGDDGVEAWLFLVQKEMLILGSNPRFLEYASSN